MPKLVCTGATLQCSMDTTPATFAASGVQTSTGTPVGVVTDVTAANVPPFGMCRSLANPQVAAATAAAKVLTPQPCLPVLVARWTPGSAGVTISKVSVLDDACRCTCTWNGVITVSSGGQIAASDR